MMRPLFLLLALAIASGAHAQADEASRSFAGADRARGETFAEREARMAERGGPETAPAAYVVRDRVPLAASRGGASLRTLRRRDGVRVLEEADGWSRVAWNEVEGWLPSDALSNVWIRISKTDRTAYVYQGGHLWRELPIDVSNTPDGDKTRRAGRLEKEEHRIPEGTFFVTRRNEDSNYYLAFVLSYPTPVHALRGLEDGLISQAQYESIVSAHREFREPPQNTRLGGLIEIHGSGSGRRRAWTRGCVALRNVHMDALWEIVEVGTPVVIEP